MFPSVSGWVSNRRLARQVPKSLPHLSTAPLAVALLTRIAALAIEHENDKTQRRRGEEIAQRLAAIVQSSEDAIVGKDLNGRIMSWNAGAARLFGYSAEEAIGRPISIIIPPHLILHPMGCSTSFAMEPPFKSCPNTSSSFVI